MPETGLTATPPMPWIPPVCYTRSTREAPTNPCHTCHQRGRRPNALDDSELQLVYDFTEPGRHNHWTNATRKKATGPSDAEIDRWVRTDNRLPPETLWGIHFAPDASGWDLDPSGERTGWRAYSSRPFPGFTPADGNWGDAFIRLPRPYRTNAEQYRINLAILDALLIRRDVSIDPVDERIIGLDVDRDGQLGPATTVRYAFDGPGSMAWAGVDAPAVPGLFPEGTEILHTVRYLNPTSPVTMAKRMKEVRYMVKNRWHSMADLASGVAHEEAERAAFPDRIEPVIGDADEGVANGSGWRLRGYIEDRDGTLRKQTKDELASCIGCHGGIGRNTDSTLSYTRRQAWGHRTTLTADIDAKRADGAGEFATWVEATGDERTPLPSADEARQLNKNYRSIVSNQSFVYGRDPRFEQNLFETVQPSQPTHNPRVVGPAWLRTD